MGRDDLRSMALAALAALTLAAAPSAAAAQERLAHDIIGEGSPARIFCGFCATEKVGVVFRELVGARGLEPRDFPLTLDGVEIAVGAATAESSTRCDPSMTGGTMMAPLEIWVGQTLPDPDIHGNPELDAWAADESLVWAGEAPLTLSAADDMGLYSVSFNSFDLRDEMGTPIVVDSGVYLRVVMTLPSGPPARSPFCDSIGAEAPGGFPFRDEGGLIANNRSFLYAAGDGWYWNEAVPGGALNGDWAIRLRIVRNPAGGTDGGVLDPDAGVDAGSVTDAGSGTDAGAPPMDAGGARDAGTGGVGGGGCSCHVAGARSSRPALGALVFALGLGLALRRRRRAR